MSAKLEEFEVTSRAQLRAWLAAHADQTESVWIIRYKKAAGDCYVPYDDLVEEALCFGWVDSRPRALDAYRSMNLLSPRKQGSAWSKVNKARVEKLIEGGLMEQRGLEKIEQAKKDGSWTFLDDVDNGIAPDDLIDALKGYPNALANFEAFPLSFKKIILEWIKNAKRPETRQKRIKETAEKAEDNVRANHYRR